jgi:hypothetical protein
MSYPYYYLIYKPKGSTTAQGFLAYADVYRTATENLLKEYLENPPRPVFSIAPLLYLLRHYIELQLKGIIKLVESSYKPEGHDVKALYEKAMNVIDKKYGLEELGQSDSDCERFIKILGETDASLARYPQRLDEEDFAIDGWLKDRIYTLEAFKDIAEKVISSLEGVEGFLDMKHGNCQENWRNQ